MPGALSARDSIVAHSIVAGDQNDLIISLDYFGTAAHFLWEVASTSNTPLAGTSRWRFTMIASHRAYLAIVLLAATVSVLGAPLAHAGSPMHFSGKRRTIHSQERFHLTNRRLPCSHQALPQQQDADPFADMILG